MARMPFDDSNQAKIGEVPVLIVPPSWPLYRSNPSRENVSELARSSRPLSIDGFR